MGSTISTPLASGSVPRGEVIASFSVSGWAERTVASTTSAISCLTRLTSPAPAAARVSASASAAPAMARSFRSGDGFRELPIRDSRLPASAATGVSGDAVGAEALGAAAADWGATAGAAAGAGADAGVAAADVDAAGISETGVRALASAAAAREGAGNRTTGAAVIVSLAAAKRLISRCCKAMKAMDAASIRHRALTMAGVSQRRRRGKDQRGSGGGKAAGAAAAGGAGAAGRPTAVDRTRSFKPAGRGVPAGAEPVSRAAVSWKPSRTSWQCRHRTTW